MISLANTAATKILAALTAQTGLNSSIAALAQTANVSLGPISNAQLFTGQISSDIAEKAGDVKYTAVYVYCDKITNTLKEKFRSFSGRIRLAVEIRVSQDRLENIDQQLQLYTEAVTQVLNANRGDWGQGLFYTGGYEVAFGPVKHGGRNFIKHATVTIEVDGSVN